MSYDLKIPCRIDDEVYVIRRYRSEPTIKKGKVSQMYFVGKEMRLAIVVENIARGEWGKVVFATYGEALERLTTLIQKIKNREENQN